MLKILVVDDEAVEREVIRFLLHKFQMPFEFTEEINGKNALSRLEQEKFDILLTDIRMPFVDGLTLANKARELYPDIYIIFFSGFDDFAYVKEALSLHVINYILKPIDPEEFKRTISDIMEQIRIREKLQKEKKATQDYIQNHLLYQFIYKRKSIAQLKLLYPEFDFSFVYACHRLFLIQLDKDSFGMETDNSDTSSLELNLKQLLPEDSYLINLNPSESLILIAGQEKSFLWYQNLADKLVTRIQQSCQVNCFIAISNSFSDPVEIYAAYKSAEMKLQERFFFDGTFTETSSLVSSDLHMENEDTLLKHLQTDIQFKDSFSLKKHMTILLDTYKRQENISHIYLLFQCCNILKILLDALPDDKNESFDKYANAIHHAKHFSEIEALLIRLTNKLASILDRRQETPDFLMDKVKRYIHYHYADDLSLNILAGQVYLTPHYLSALFINETGIGISRYIKKIRMEKAKELLLNTNLKIADICTKVGYSNTSYFCKSFTEEFGTTPHQFRNTVYSTERS